MGTDPLSGWEPEPCSRPFVFSSRGSRGLAALGTQGARIGVTRSTQAWFLTADRQCTELPLLRLPRLVHEFRGSDPMRQTRDLARVGWRGLGKARKHALRLPLLPIGPHERPRLADSFPRLGQARGASPGSLDQRSEEWPLCEGKSGALDASVRRETRPSCNPRKANRRAIQGEPGTRPTGEGWDPEEGE